MTTLTYENGAVVLQSRYDPGLVLELKQRIPASERQFDPATKAWRVDPAHALLLVQLVQQYFGERLVAPAITTTTAQHETTLLEVKYIGACKPRGANDTPTAYAWSNGWWSAIFPEPVLREWFDAPKRPDEETTLYQVLTVKQNADPNVLKSAYRRLARQWHPDVCHEPGANEVFKAINHAYEILSDPSKRARYDAGLALSASLQRRAPQAVDLLSVSYRAPLRCGYVLCEGVDKLGRFVVARVLAWEDIVDLHGRVLSTSWPAGAEMFVETWL